MYRQGTIGAFLDIYEQVILDFIKLLENIPDKNLDDIINPKETDENCRSIQSILSHVIYSGFGYATSIFNSKGNKIIRPDNTFHFTVKEYIEDLSRMFSYTESTLNAFKDDEVIQFTNSLKIKSGWGQFYDIEQMMEHAIVHILRHKRQIEKLLFEKLHV